MGGASLWSAQAQKGCCMCSRQDKGDCKDAKSAHTRKRSFCTDQTTEGDCLSAGGRHWISIGTCRWTCPKANSLPPVAPPPPPPLPGDAEPAPLPDSSASEDAAKSDLPLFEAQGRS